MAEILLFRAGTDLGYRSFTVVTTKFITFVVGVQHNWKRRYSLVLTVNLAID